MTNSIDEMVRSVAPITDERVCALQLGEAEAELRAAIVAEPTELRIRGHSLRRRTQRWRLSGVAVAGLVAVVLVVALAGGGQRLGTRPEQAWAAPLLRVANSVPRMLIGADGWKVSRADEFTVDEGEMTFSNGDSAVDLHWHSTAGPESSVESSKGAVGALGLRAGPGAVKARLEKLEAGIGERLEPVAVEGARAMVFRYEATADDFTARWRNGRYDMELRTGFGGAHRLTKDEFRKLLGSLRTVGVDRWLSAMPASVVVPTETAAAVAAMLKGIPLPTGFDQRPLTTGQKVRDHYQLGARVTGAVACAWIERWLTASGAGDAAAAREAVAAMQTSHRWPILQEMNADGDYPEVVWQYADAMAGKGRVAAEKPITVSDSYRSVLGC
jgi:hypothetical protein